MPLALPCAADAVAPAPTAAQLEVQAKISALTEERKALLAEGPREKHFNWGSLLLALGVAIGVEGPVNTYMRTGKLFPGPHLYAGAGIVVLWATAAACVPQMQKGNDTARNVHIALNCVNLALFAWQARASGCARMADAVLSLRSRRRCRLAWRSLGRCFSSQAGKAPDALDARSPAHPGRPPRMAGPGASAPTRGSARLTHAAARSLRRP